MTLAVRFYEVRGEDMSADGGFIEVAASGEVTVSDELVWVMDLPAPSDPKDFKSASTRPTGGFKKIGSEGGKTVLQPVGSWDPEAWLDKVRYHFRTPYLRPGDVERS